MAASCDHAFDTWTMRPTLWWPRSHTTSGTDLGEIVFEGYPGGRIFERSADGTEHDWGQVTAWEPPNRVAYKWHLFFRADEATDVDVTFRPIESGTSVRIEQSGWHRLDTDRGDLRSRFHGGWQAISAAYPRLRVIYELITAQQSDRSRRSIRQTCATGGGRCRPSVTRPAPRAAAACWVRVARRRRGGAFLR